MRWALALLSVIVALVGGFAAGVAVSREDEVRDGRGRVTEPRAIDVVELRVGDCVEEVEAGTEVAVRVTPCRRRHEGEVVSRSQLPAGPWPGPKKVLAAAGRRCGRGFHFAPSESSWRQDDRVVTCIARS